MIKEVSNILKSDRPVTRSRSNDDASNSNKRKKKIDETPSVQHIETDHSTIPSSNFSVSEEFEEEIHLSR